MALWTAALQFAALFIAAAVTFVAEPPSRFDQGGEFAMRPFLDFVLVVLFLCLLVWLRTRPRPLVARTHALIALLLLLAATGSLYFYRDTSAAWSCPVPSEQGVDHYVMGGRVAADMAKSYPDSTCTEWFESMGGYLDRVWEQGEITARHTWLLAWYLATVLGFALSAMFAIEAVRSQFGEDDAAGTGSAPSEVPQADAVTAGEPMSDAAPASGEDET